MADVAPVNGEIGDPKEAFKDLKGEAEQKVKEILNNNEAEGDISAGVNGLDAHVDDVITDAGNDVTAAAAETAESAKAELKEAVEELKERYFFIFIDREAGEIIRLVAPVRPSVCPSMLSRLNRLTFDLDFWHEGRS